MRIQIFQLAAVALALALTACSKRETPVQTALGELQLLGSDTETGLKHSEYLIRLRQAQHRISAALQTSKDAGAKARIEDALNFFVHAQGAWERESGRGSDVPSEVKALWSEGRRATDNASTFALADPAKRTKIWQQELAIVEAATQAEQAAKEQAAQDERTRQAQEAEAEAQRWAAEQRHAADRAEREKIRRFAPDGTVYSLIRISFATPEGVLSIAPGTELKVIGKLGGGMLQVTTGSLETQVPASAVTNDRDVAAALHRVPVRHAMDDVRKRSASSARVNAAATP